MRLITKLALRLPRSLSAPSSARSAIRVLASRVGTDAIVDLELLATEVVANAVVHGPTERPGGIAVDIFEFDDMVRVEVRDQGPGFTALAPDLPDLDEVGGCGLYLLNVMADRWGVNGDGSTMVWFELDIDSNGSRSNGPSSNSSRSNGSSFNGSSPNGEGRGATESIALERS